MPASGSELVALVAGRADGEILVLDEPLSFWGGVDPHTGKLIDRHHPQRGARITGKVLVMPSGRGSSSSSSVLAEAVRTGTAPAAIILRERDPIVVLGAVVAHELYGRAVPVVVADAATYEDLASRTRIRVDASKEGALLEPL